MRPTKVRKIQICLKTLKASTTIKLLRFSPLKILSEFLIWDQHLFLQKLQTTLMKTCNMPKRHPSPKFDSVMQNYDIPRTLLLFFAIVYEGARNGRVKY